MITAINLVTNSAVSTSTILRSPIKMKKREHTSLGKKWVKEMNIPKKYREEHYRIWYELLCRSPRIPAKEASLSLGIEQKTSSARLKEALNQHYIVGPEVRKMSLANFPEYMYFVNCKNPDSLYRKYRQDENVIFHALMYGFANLWVISKGKMDIDGDIIVEGLRSDYYVAFAPDHSWDDAVRIIRKKIEKFNPEEYTPKGYIKTHFDKTIEWTEKDEILYRYFKNDMRKPLAPMKRDYHISRNEFRKWLERLPDCCTITTNYYPGKLSEYESYLFLFETDYEDFIVELFSELPSSSRFFRVSDKLFLYAHVPKKYIKDNDLHTEPNRLTIPSLSTELLTRGIIRRGSRGPIETYWAQDL